MDGTFAGRVYRSGQALPLSNAGGAHLWVPHGHLAANGLGRAAGSA